MIIALTLLLAYLIGSIPFGLLLTKLAGHGDIRSIGSGNIGATNVMRTGNKKLAALVLLLDGLKGYVAVVVAQHLSPGMMLLAGIISVLAHIFPVWLSFKGGKGVATAIGTLFALDYHLGLMVITLWLITFTLSRISSLSALVAFFITAILLIILVYIPPTFYWFSNWYLHNIIGIKNLNGYVDLNLYIESLGFRVAVDSAYLIIITLLLFFTHRENINRLIRGTEPRFGVQKT